MLLLPPPQGSCGGKRPVGKAAPAAAAAPPPLDTPGLGGALLDAEFAPVRPAARAGSPAEPAPPDARCCLLAPRLAQPTREVLRPPNQLALSEAELGEEVAKMLTANNPAAPQNVARFNMKERSYKFEPMVEQHVRLVLRRRAAQQSTAQRAALRAVLMRAAHAPC